MNSSRHDEASGLMMLILDELPNDVTGPACLRLETIGNRAEEIGRLGEWDNGQSLAETLGESVLKDFGTTSLSSLEAVLDEAMGDKTQVDVGPYRFTRELGLADDQLYSITKNPRYSDYKSNLIRLYRLGALQGTPTK